MSESEGAANKIVKTIRVPLDNLQIAVMKWGNFLVF